jgi:arylsulfatase A-like enzyme
MKVLSAHTDGSPRLGSRRGLVCLLWVALTTGLAWGAAEAVYAWSQGGPSPFTVLLFYPLVTAAAGLVLWAVMCRLPAGRGLEVLALALVALAIGIPLAVWINVKFVRDVPFVSVLNLGILVGAYLAGLMLSLALLLPIRAGTRRMLRWRGPRFLAAVLCVVPLLLLAGSGVHVYRTLLPREPGSWPDNRGPLSDQPNVVLIVLDTLRADHVSSYGYFRETTPHLDNLPGVRFERAYAQGHWTVPSTATLLTGLHPSTHQTNDVGSKLPRALTTLPEILRDAGYVTGYITGNFVVSPVFGFTQGCRYIVSRRQLPNYQLYPSSLGHVLVAKVHDLSRADGLNRWALPFLRSVVNRRFFLYLHYKDPHDPYELPGAMGGFDPGFSGRRILDPSIRAQWPISERERANMVARYDGEIRFLDQQVGRIFDELRRLDLQANTLVVVTSDHGEEFQEHGGWIHGETVYEEILRVPLFLSYPTRLGQTGQRTVTAPARHVDLLPTILELTGLPPLPEAQGRSLVPLLAGDPEDEEVVILSEGSKTGLTAMVRGSHKLIKNEGGGTVTYELYDLANDPGEREDLSASRPELLQRLQVMMERTLAQYRQGAAVGEMKVLDAVEEEAFRQLGYIK